MDTHTFYLHEDDWGMISLVPSEARTWCEAVAREARAFGDEHLDGQGWTDMYVLPDTGREYPLSQRRLPLAALPRLVGPRLPAATIVETGYSSHREALDNCFAFGRGYGGGGAFYGTHRDGIVQSLHVVRPGGEDADVLAAFVAALTALGSSFDLILVDWWEDRVVDLRDEAAVISYLQGEDAEGVPAGGRG